MHAFQAIENLKKNLKFEGNTNEKFKPRRLL